MAKVDVIYINTGNCELELRGYCSSDGFDIESIIYEGVDVYDLLADLDSFFNLDFSKIQELADDECCDYIDRVYNPENQI